MQELVRPQSDADQSPIGKIGREKAVGAANEQAVQSESPADGELALSTPHRDDSPKRHEEERVTYEHYPDRIEGRFTQFKARRLRHKITFMLEV